ncbi:MAG: flagellar biosynthesis protein FlhB [Planctomycetes bacterium]|nr:flagellar biosynthesis protein FlhB [Planctomycetota bacterium]
MAGEDDDKQDKTEDATPRKRQDAREEGQVALSTELVSATLLWAGLGLLVVGGGAIAQACGALVTNSANDLGALGKLELDVQSGALLFENAARMLGLALLGVVAPMWAVALLVSYAQIGFQITTKAVRFDPSRLDPTKGFKRLFGVRVLMRTLLALVKVIVILVSMGCMAWHELPKVAALAGSELGPMLDGLGHVALRCAGAALVAIAVVAAGDWSWQRWQHERELRMTKREIRDEARSTEGDPHIKARVRQVQREMAQRRMMSDVPKATVVITNPTHYAVALRYERDAQGKKKRAPVVVAKGVDLVAQRIKQVARDADVPLFEDVPLARALHAQCEIGDEVPEALYQAVAAVLAYVYRVQGEAVRA